MGFNCLKARATSKSQFTFTTQFPEVSGIHFIDLGRMKGWVDLGATKWFWTQDPSTANPVPYSPYIKIRDVEERWSAKTQR